MRNYSIYFSVWLPLLLLGCGTITKQTSPEVAWAESLGTSVSDRISFFRESGADGDRLYTNIGLLILNAHDGRAIFEAYHEGKFDSQKLPDGWDYRSDSREIIVRSPATGVVVAVRDNYIVSVDPKYDASLQQIRETLVALRPVVDGSRAPFVLPVHIHK